MINYLCAYFDNQLFAISVTSNEVCFDLGDGEADQGKRFCL